jgi:hypothetical protein
VDPDLQDSTCLCPQRGCLEGFIWREDGWAESACPRCQGTGYVICDEIQEGEASITMAQERSTVQVRVGRNHGNVPL